MDKRPFIEVFFPVLFCTLEILVDLLDRFHSRQLVGGVALEQGTHRRQIPIVLPVANVAPGPAGHKIVWVGFRHQLLEQALKSIALGLQKGNAEIFLVVELLNAIHGVQSRDRMTPLGAFAAVRSKCNVMASCDPVG